jgi:hypothetical protein
MKKLKICFIKLIVLGMICSSCGDFVDPVLPYKDFDFAVYLRTVAVASSSFDSQNLSNSRFAITIEAVDPELGGTVESVEVRVRHRRLVEGVGNVYIPSAGANNEVVDVLVKTLTSSDFGPNSESRFLRAEVQVTAPEILAALGLSEDQIQSGDNFEIRLNLRDKFGRTFNDINAGPNVRGGAFYASPFLYNVGVN